MQKFITFLSVIVTLCVSLLISPLKLLAQEQQNLKLDDLSPKSVVFGLDSNKIKIEYVEMSSAERMKILAEKLAPENFPMITLPQGIFEQGVNVVKDLESLSYLYGNVQKELVVIKRLGEQRDSLYKSIISFENERVELIRGANQELNLQIDQLNKQLDTSMNLVDESLKGRNRKNFTIGVLGGLAGISAGVILGLLVGN